MTRLGDFWTLGNFLKPLATINLPKSPTFLGIFYKGVKYIIFLVKSFLGKFYGHLAIFFWSHCVHKSFESKGCSLIAKQCVFNKFVKCCKNVLHFQLKYWVVATYVRSVSVVYQTLLNWTRSLQRQWTDRLLSVKFGAKNGRAETAASAIFCTVVTVSIKRKKFTKSKIWMKLAEKLSARFYGRLNSWVVSHLALNIGMLCHAMPWAMSSSLGDDKLLFGPTFFMIQFSFLIWCYYLSCELRNRKLKIMKFIYLQSTRFYYFGKDLPTWGNEKKVLRYPSHFGAVKKQQKKTFCLCLVFSKAKLNLENVWIGKFNLWRIRRAGDRMK